MSGIEVRPIRDEDRDVFARIHGQAFSVPTVRLRYARETAEEEGWVVTVNGAVAGGLRAERFGQWFGGRAVASAGVSAVKIAPEARGRGLGRRLVDEVLRALRPDTPLSMLYPVTAATYRRSGYELAGDHIRWRTSLASLDVRSPLAVEPWGDDALDDVARCYEAFAAGQAGLVSRPAGWWSERVLLEGDRPLYRYLVRRDGAITGYMVYTQRPEPDAELPYSFSVDCRDFVWLDADSARALLAHAGAHRGLGVAMTWAGPPADPLGLLLGGPPARPELSFPWMLRILDVKAALEARGWPAHAEGNLELDVADDVLPENAGRWRVSVRGGAASAVRPDADAGGAGPASASVSLHITTLAALYSGWLHPRDAARAGRLEGAGEAELGTLERLFAGPRPWIMKLF